MKILQFYFLIIFFIHFAHVYEELITDYHKQFPFFKMNLQKYLIIEFIFISLMILSLGVADVALRSQIFLFFLIFEFGNGLWHIGWSLKEGRYRPGFYTGSLLVILLIAMYLNELL